MKNKHPLATILVFALLTLLAGALLIPLAILSIDEPSAAWKWNLSISLIALAFLLLLGLAFVPFSRTRRALPVWFRAHWFVPVLFLLLWQIGCAFPFTHHQQTHELPGFLLGSNDWGSGNIYTFTKLVDWLALFAGCLACGRLPGDPLPAARGFSERCRLCLPHLVAAAILHISARDSDNLLLYPWFLVGFAAVAGLQAVANDPIRRCSRILPWLAAAAWIFMPVALQRP